MYIDLIVGETKGRKNVRYRSSIDDRSRYIKVRLAKRILDRTAPLFLSSQVRIYRSRWIDSAINKLNCIMDVSKRVRVLRSESIIMYMRSSYRLVHLRCLKRPLTPVSFASRGHWPISCQRL